MKLPKFILRVAGREFVVPHNRGVAALVSLLCDAIPVSVDLEKREIELSYDDRPDITSWLTNVRIDRIPRGMRWTRKNKEGVVVEVTPVAKPMKALRPAPGKAKALPQGKRPHQLGRGVNRPLQLEF